MTALQIEYARRGRLWRGGPRIGRTALCVIALGIAALFAVRVLAARLDLAYAYTLGRWAMMRCVTEDQSYCRMSYQQADSAAQAAFPVAKGETIQ